MDRLIKTLSKAVSKIDWETEQNDLLTDKLLDSIDIISIVSEITAEYGIEIPPEEMEEENFNSVQGIADMIARIQNEEF